MEDVSIPRICNFSFYCISEHENPVLDCRTHRITPSELIGLQWGDHSVCSPQGQLFSYCRDKFVREQNPFKTATFSQIRSIMRWVYRPVRPRPRTPALTEAMVARRIEGDIGLAADCSTLRAAHCDTTMPLHGLTRP
jgi:hypothetical protein